MSSSNESTNFEETDSAPDVHGELERGRGRQQGKKKTTKKATKKSGGKRKGTGQSREVKKRKTRASSPNPENQETQAPEEETNPPEEETCPLEKMGGRLMAKLMMKNIKVATTCSPCNKSLLECIVETVMESLLSDETPQGCEDFVECLANALTESVVKIFGEIQFPGGWGQDELVALVENQVAKLKEQLVPLPESD